MSRKKLYTLEAINDCISELLSAGYEYIELEEGGLGLGRVVLLAPCEGWYNYIFEEVPLNEWSSAHTARRRCKLSQALLDEINAVIS